MTKLDFQDDAVTKLIEKFKRLWSAEGSMLPLVFKSPTGSGKTFMVESFMQELKTVGGFNEDIAWIWITFSDELAMQSKAKFEEYFYPNVGRRLLTVADFADGILKRDDVLFLNWQKLVANDAERMFMAKCREMLEGQTDEETRVGNIARSESIFRMGVRNWLKGALPDVASESGRYKIFLNDVLKGAGSVMLAAVTSALKAYAPARRKLVAARKSKAAEVQPSVFLLKREYEYPDGYEEYLDANGDSPRLSVVKPFYVRKKWESETEFIAFMEGNAAKIEWWLKNGDDGKDWFGLKYFNTTEKEERLFYPDWIVKFKDGRIGIFDTKGGRTAVNPEGREAGLRNKIAAMNKAAGADLFWGGLTVSENGLWYWHDGEGYSYAPGKLDGWKQLVF